MAIIVCQMIAIFIFISYQNYACQKVIISLQAVA